MSGDANNHGAGTSAAGAQGPAGTPYATAGPPRPGDVSGQQQTTAYADAGVASVVNQFAGMGLGASVPMQGYHIAQPAVYPPMFSYSGMGLHGPGFVMQDANGNSYPSNDFQAPTVDNRFYSDYLHKMGNFQQELHQAPVNPREGMMKYYENLGLRGMRSELTPSLDKRRSSYSTNESTPATPFYGSTASREAGARVAVFDRGSSAYTTPSPPQLTSTGLVVQPKGFSPIPAPIPAPVSREIQQLLIRDPAIPQAVPAVFTPRENMKTLEQSLTNSIPGNRNVYIRGLHPTTDDDLLLAYTDRFGEVETSKAIIDTATGACKGFGFAKFKTVKESEDCIRGFYAMGYEVGFARVGDHVSSNGSLVTNSFNLSWLASAGASADESRPEIPTLPNMPTTLHDSPQAVKMCNCPCEYHSDQFTNFDPWDQESFNSRLKAEGDEGSTNLYISNLPKSVNETDLGTIFVHYTILSAKILRDNLGNSRGVGFARFESRDVCDEIITNFTGQPLGDESLPMQIRYADTPAQKELKRVTSERRQFRTNEYNVGAYGTPLVGMSPTIYSQPAWKQRGISNGSTQFLRPSFVPGPGHLKDDKAGVGRTLAINSASMESPIVEDESEDEGVTVHVDSPLVVNGSTQSSPIKKDKD